MSGFLLDTNVVSELRKGDRADEHLRRWFTENDASAFWLSTLVVAELRRGVELIDRRDAVAGSALRAWLDSIVEDFRDEILPVTLAIGQRWARLSEPDPLPVIDGLVAATAIEHDLTLVTRNVDDIARTGVSFVSPFTPPPSAP